ncbi:hypothetical protein GWL_26710 [Herbaspirillum sp. GW103]|nr:hypothetical protein GWL_26710 [Herbaspirillum sp. GW103]
MRAPTLQSQTDDLVRHDVPYLHSPPDATAAPALPHCCRHCHGDCHCHADVTTATYAALHYHGITGTRLEIVATWGEDLILSGNMSRPPQPL